MQYECGTCGNKWMRLQGRGRPVQWEVTCLNGHVLTPDVATTYTIAPDTDWIEENHGS